MLRVYNVQLSPIFVCLALTTTDAIEYVVFLQVPATEEMVIGTSSHITTGGYRQKCSSDGLVGNDTIHVCTDYIYYI